MTTIATTNFVRGGKSSIARLLAERLGTTILNFDPKRDAKFYNAIKTTNIPGDSEITVEGNKVIAETDEEITEVTSKTGMFVCDFGGRFDDRLSDFPTDAYIVPTMEDFESMSETARATKYIQANHPDAKIIHVLNMYACQNKGEREDFVEEYRTVMASNKVKGIKYLIMPRSKMLKKLVNDKVLRSDVTGHSAFLEKGAYRKIIKFVDELVEELENLDVLEKEVSHES